MSYDVVIFGVLRLSRAKADDWKEAGLRAPERDAALARAFPGSPPAPDTTVGKLLGELAKLAAPGSGELFDVRLEGGEARVGGMMGEDTFGERACGVGAALFAAADKGAEGEVTIAGVGADFGHRVRLAKGRARVTELTVKEARAAASSEEARALREAAIPSVARAVLAEARATRAGSPQAPAPPARSPVGGVTPSAPKDDPASARALDALRSDPVASLREGREPHFTEIGAKTAEMNRLLGVLRGARYEPAVPAIVDIWRSHPWSFVRQHAERLLLEWGTPAALAPIADKLEDYAKESEEYDQGSGQSLAAIEAVFRLDPAKAYDRLAPYFDEKRKKDPVATSIAQGTFSALGRVGGGAADTDAQAAARAWLLADPRWIDLALRVLRERDDSTLYGAIAALVATRDPRAPKAIAELLEYDLVELDTVVEALRALGDPGVAKAVSKAAAARKKKKAEAAKLSALAAELEKKG